MPHLVANNAASTLASGITNVATTLTVAAGQGNRFPVAAGADYFHLTLQDASGNIEIVKVTARALGSDSMTVARAQESTTAIAWSAGAIIGLRATAALMAPLTVMEGASTAALIRTKIGAEAAFPSGTRLAFAQSAAPTGWTQDTSDNANNRMLRVVNTVGGGVGGSHSPILNNVVPAHTHGFTTGTESVDHYHGGSTGGVSSGHQHYSGFSGVNANAAYGVGYPGPGGNINNQSGTSGMLPLTSGITSDHGHSFNTGGRSAAHTHSGSTDNGSSQTNWSPRYIDLIICAKN